MLTEFGNIFIFILVAMGFVLLVLTLGKFIRPDNPNPIKNSVYECGEPPVGSGTSQFNMRFYLIAFVFVIFDVEIAFMYPVTVIFRDLLQDGWGWLALVEIALFVLILLVGFIYAWTQGGLDWERSLSDSTE